MMNKMPSYNTMPTILVVLGVVATARRARLILMDKNAHGKEKQT
jgi:hypothetical protein